jgi:hypothetical protein
MSRTLSTLLLGLVASPAWAGTLQLTSDQSLPRAQGAKRQIDISCTSDGECTIFENNQEVTLSEVSTEAVRDVQTGKLRIAFGGRARR